MLAMLLSTMKRLPDYRELQLNRSWSKLGPAKTLSGSEVLCVGTGDLGSSFATLCKAFGAHTVGVRKTAGVIELIGSTLANLSGDGSRSSIFLVYTVIVWMSVLLSAFIDNIPYTATMLPVVTVVTQRLSEAGGIDVSPNLLYFGLLVGATLGGNLTPIGASANIAGIGILRKERYLLTDYFRYLAHG